MIANAVECALTRWQPFSKSCNRHDALRRFLHRHAISMRADDDDADAAPTRASALDALGLARDVTDADVIKRAYRAACLRWHPDKNPRDVEKAQRMFTTITAAYHALTTTNFDYARWRRTYAIPPLQSLEDVLAMALSGCDPMEIEATLRARGEFRPHAAFGVDVHVPWCAGGRAEASYDVHESAYTTTRAIGGGDGGDGGEDVARGLVARSGTEVVSRHADGDAVVGASAARPWERVGGVGFDGDCVIDRARASTGHGAFVGRPDLDATSSDASTAAEALNDAGVKAFNAQDYDTAYKYHAEAVRLAPRTVAYLGNQAAAALKVGGQGDTRRRRDALTLAVEASVAATAIDDKYVRGYVRGAKALLILGDYGDGDVKALRRAREMLEKALNVDPTHGGATSTLKDVNVSLQLFDDDSD